MEKAQEILLHIDELYTENPSEEKIIRACQENPVRYQAWVDAFKDYDLSDVLQAIDEYWEYKNSKTKPNVAQIKAKLNAKNTEKIVETTVAEQAKGDYAWERMNDDIESGNCCNNLYVYRDAEKIILTEWLSHEMPASIWASMNRAARIKQAQELGLYDRFDEALKQAAQMRFGRDFECESANILENAKANKKFDLHKTASSIAAHWRA